MKKKIILSVISLLVLSLMLPVSADQQTVVSTTTNTTSSTASVTKKYVRRAVVVRGVIKEIKGTTVPADLVVTVASATPKKSNKTVGAYPTTAQDLTVKVDSKTNIIRKYGGKSDLTEFAAGDRVQIVGKINEDGTFTASLIRNESIKNTLLVRSGKVIAVDAVNNTFVLIQSDKNLTIKVTDKTKLIIAKITVPTFANLKVNDTVQVRGVINTRTNILEASLVKVTPVKEIKNSEKPVKEAKAVKTDKTAEKGKNK